MLLIYNKSSTLDKNSTFGKTSKCKTQTLPSDFGSRPQSIIQDTQKSQTIPSFNKNTENGRRNPVQKIPPPRAGKKVVEVRMKKTLRDPCGCNPHHVALVSSLSINNNKASWQIMASSGGGGGAWHLEKCASRQLVQHPIAFRRR